MTELEILGVVSDADELTLRQLYSLVDLLHEDTILLSDSTLKLAYQSLVSQKDNSPIVLRALGALLYKRVHLLVKELPSILCAGSILDQNLNSKDIACRLSAVLCIRNCCAIEMDCVNNLPPECLFWCSTALAQCLSNNANCNFASHKACKLISSCFKSLLSIYKKESLVSSKTASIFGALKVYIGFGLVGCSNQPETFDDVPPVFQPISGKAPQYKRPRKAKKCKWRRQLDKNGGLEQSENSSSSHNESEGWEISSVPCTPIILRPQTNWSRNGAANIAQSTAIVTSSESEVSDHQSVKCVQFYQIGVRLNAIALMTQILPTCNQGVICSYWLHFFPDPIPSYFCSNHKGLGIPQILLEEKCSKVICHLLSCINHWLLQCSSLLKTAEHSRQQSMTFTPLSQVLAGSLSELFRVMLYILGKERKASVIIQILKTLSYLIKVAPLSKLDDLIILDLFKYLKQFQNHSDTNVRVAFLCCTFACLQSNSNNVSHALELDGMDNNLCRIWLWKCCAQSLNHSSPHPLPVKLHSMQNLAALILHFPAEAKSAYQQVCDINDVEKCNSDTEMQLHMFRLLKAMCMTCLYHEDWERMKSILTCMEECKVFVAICSKSPPTSYFLEYCDTFGSLPLNKEFLFSRSFIEDLCRKCESFLYNCEFAVKRASCKLMLHVVQCFNESKISESFIMMLVLKLGSKENQLACSTLSSIVSKIMSPLTQSCHEKLVCACVASLDTMNTKYNINMRLVQEILKCDKLDQTYTIKFISQIHNTLIKWFYENPIVSSVACYASLISVMKHLNYEISCSDFEQLIQISFKMLLKSVDRNNFTLCHSVLELFVSIFDYQPAALQMNYARMLETLLIILEKRNENFKDSSAQMVAVLIARCLSLCCVRDLCQLKNRFNALQTELPETLQKYFSSSDLESIGTDLDICMQNLSKLSVSSSDVEGMQIATFLISCFNESS